MSKIYLCSNTKINDKNVENLALCKIKFMPFKLDLNAYDALILTSKNAIKALRFNHISPNVKMQVFAIGKNSASSAKRYGFSDIYTAKNSLGNAFGLEILPFLKDKKALYICASKRTSKLDEILCQNGIDLHTKIAYENIIKTEINALKAPPKNSVLIFTSPLNVKAFLTHFSWDNSYEAIAIGATTAAALNFICKPKIAKNQTIKECLNLAKQQLTKG